MAVLRELRVSEKILSDISKDTDVRELEEISEEITEKKGKTLQTEKEEMVQPKIRL